MLRGLCVVGLLAACAAASVHAAADGPRPALRTECGGISDSQPVWAPYGRVVAFTRESEGPLDEGIAFRIYRLDADGTKLRRLSPATYPYARFPAWAPDAAHIAFGTLDDWGVARIVIVTLAGTDPVVVDMYPIDLGIGLQDVGLAWSSDETRLAYGRNGWIYVARADGGGTSRLVEGQLPVWSPNGRRIAYVTKDARLALVNADGSDFHTIASNLWAPYYAAPVWSPDGKRLAYSLSGPAAAAVAVVDADSAGQQLVDPHGAHPRWSPDGKRLVDEVSITTHTRGAVHVVDIAARRIRTITHDDSLRYGSDDFAPEWSPDGKTIVFTSITEGSLFRGTTMQGSELRLVDADGLHERRLTYHCTTGYTGQAVNEINGSWLPDLVLGTPRPDTIDAGPGEDTILARGGGRDTIDCGSGVDAVYADRSDRVSRDCEVVRYAPSTSRPAT